MLRIRTTKLSSGNTSVQVVHRYHHKTAVIKHIGTARTEKELGYLKELANQYIKTNKIIPPLIPEVFGRSDTDDLVSLKNLQFTTATHAFAYEFLSLFYQHNGFDTIVQELFKDLSLLRVIEPASKLRSVDLLNEYFHITYPINRVYEEMRGIRHQKEAAEQAAVAYAKKYLGFDFSLVFYDVTTLYFETFTEDTDETDAKGYVIKSGLRKNGYGKEKKVGQPLIMVGLVVNGDGYPISVEMFSGKTFEGHTMLPVVKRLQEKYGIKTLTIVADAAMLSLDNTKAISQAELSYIVGARTGSIPEALMQTIAGKIQKVESKYIRVKTDWGHTYL